MHINSRVGCSRESFRNPYREDVGIIVSGVKYVSPAD